MRSAEKQQANERSIQHTISASRLATPTSIAMLAMASSFTLYSVSFVPTSAAASMQADGFNVMMMIMASNLVQLVIRYDKIR